VIKEEENEKKRWYELPILITVIGSMILLIGNFCVSLAPTEDDFSISIDNVSMEAKLSNEETYSKDNDLVEKKEGEFRGFEKSQMANDNGELLPKAVPSGHKYPAQMANNNGEFLLKDVPAARINVADINEKFRNYRQQVFIKALDCPSNINIYFKPEQNEPPFDSNVYVSIKPNDSLLSKDNIITYPITIQGIGGDGKKRNCSAFIYFFPPKILVDHIGKKNLNEKQYEQALQAFDAAIGLNRSYEEAWYYKARAQYELGVEKYNSSKKPDEAVLKEAYRKAIASLNEAIKLNDTYEDARFFKAIVLFNLNRYNESLHEYLNIIEQNNSSHNVWVNKGRILEWMGRYNESLLAYKKAFALNKDGDIKALDFYYLGIEASASNDYETALQAYNKSIEINPNDLDNWCEKTCILYQLGRFNESIEFADKAIRKFKYVYGLFNWESKLAYLWIVKSFALDGLRMRSEADNAYEMATNVSSSSEDWRDLSWVLFKSNMYNDSLRLASTATEKDPNDGYSWLFKSLALESLGKHDESDVAYETAVDISRKSGEINWNNYAWTLYKLGKYNESLRLANMAIAINSSSSISWDTKGAALIGLGKYQEANDCLDEAIRIKPYAMIYFHKAEALAGLGNPLSAFEFYSKAIEEEPDPFDGWYGKGNILKNLSIDGADEVLARAKELKDNVKMRYNGWY
jgi:tetratricopeptide (TPR) repeat protein